MSKSPTDWRGEAMRARVRRRYARERRFRLIGLGAIGVSVLFLAFLLWTMAANGIGGFLETRVRVPVDFPHSPLFLDRALLTGDTADTALASADIEGVVSAAAKARYGEHGAELISDAAWLR